MYTILSNTLINISHLLYFLNLHLIHLLYFLYLHLIYFFFFSILTFKILTLFSIFTFDIIILFSIFTLILAFQALAPGAETFYYSFSDLNPYDSSNEGVTDISCNLIYDLKHFSYLYLYLSF